MPKHNDLTPEAIEGYVGAPNRYLNSSPASLAHSLGAWFQRTGRPAPRDVRMSRGCNVRVADLVFRPDFHTAHAWERVQ